MQRRNTETLSSLIARYLRTEGLETPLAQRRAIDAWPTIAGSEAAKCTEDVGIRGQTMTVRLNSPLVRHELFTRREALIKALNKAAGANVVYELRLS